MMLGSPRSALGKERKDAGEGIADHLPQPPLCRKARIAFWARVRHLGCESEKAALKHWGRALWAVNGGNTVPQREQRSLRHQYANLLRIELHSIDHHGREGFIDGRRSLNGFKGMDMDPLSLRGRAGPEHRRARSPYLDAAGIIRLLDGELFRSVLEPRRFYAAGLSNAADGVSDRGLQILEVSPARTAQVTAVGMGAEPVGIEMRVAAMRAHDMAHLDAKHGARHEMHGVGLGDQDAALRHDRSHNLHRRIAKVDLFRRVGLGARMHMDASLQGQNRGVVNRGRSAP